MNKKCLFKQPAPKFSCLFICSIRQNICYITNNQTIQAPLTFWNKSLLADLMVLGPDPFKRICCRQDLF